MRERLFQRRVDLLYELDHDDPGLARPPGAPPEGDGTETATGLRHDIADRLRAEVAAMDDGNVSGNENCSPIWSATIGGPTSPCRCWS